MIRKVFNLLLLFVGATLAVGPLVFVYLKPESLLLKPAVLAAFNLLGWCLLLLLLLSRTEFRKSVVHVARTFGIDERFKSLEQLVGNLLFEIERRNESLSINLIEQRISSRQDLTRALERIVGQAYRLLDADSAELALFNPETGLYHSALVLGKPFRASAQAMLSDAAKGEDTNISPDVLVQPIAFAATMLGTLRVALRDRRLPSIGDRDIMALLALQAGLALMNSEYSRELLRMKQSADESLKAKTGFLANLSHEIRGPLGVMLNAVELVLDGLCGSVNEEQKETLRMVRGNGQHLLELINDVLDYAKVEAGKIVPQTVDMLVQQVIQDIAGVMRAQAEAKKHKLVCKIGQEALALACDRRHLRQILINLLTNAIKYTPDGGLIEIWAERIRGNRIKICVKDSGVGIEPEDVDKVFAPFQRIENSYSMNQVGTGLGLSLTKRLVEVNGGAIDFESNPGKGSTFWITLPSVDANSVSMSEDELEKIPEVNGASNVVLVVDRDQSERSSIAKFLSHREFRVLVAASKLEALELLRTQSVDLILMGNNIADSIDEDLVGLMRSELGDRKVPLVLMSSRAFVFDIERYLKSGIDRCLIKPIQLRQLAHTIRNLIDGTYSGAVVDSDALPNIQDSSKQKRLNVSRRAEERGELPN